MKVISPDIIDKAPDAIILDGVGVLARRFPRAHRLSCHRHVVGQVLHAASQAAFAAAFRSVMGRSPTRDG